jgi:hypothetical protein
MADLGLPNDQVADVNANMTISCAVGIKNRSAATVVYNVHLWVENSSLLTLDANGTWGERIGYLTSDEVVRSAIAPIQAPSGSGFFSDIYDGVKKVLPYAKPIASIAKMAFPQSKPYLEAVGLGKLGGRKKKGKGVLGGRRKGRGLIKEDDVEDLNEYMTKRG